MIPIKVSVSWAEDESALHQRVADVVIGRYPDDPPERQETGYNWRLDPANNWWANFDGANLAVAWRFEAVNGPRMVSLRNFLAWEFSE